MPSILATNGAALMLVVSLVFNVRLNHHSDAPTDRVFYAMVFFNVLQCIIEPLTFIIIGKSFTGCIPIAAALNSALYIANTLFAFMWTVYVDLKLFSDPKRTAKRCRLTSIPALVSIALALVSLAYPLYFGITPDNSYYRGDWFFISYIINYGYLLCGTVRVYMYRNRVGKNLFMPAVVFLAPVIIATVFQALFYGNSLIGLGAAIALNSLHINLQNEVSSTEELSGLYTRQYMSKFLEAAIHNASPNRKVAGIMLDIDRFKSINDTYGHLVGDDAIVSAAQIIRSSSPALSLPARFAGDEFMIICILENEDSLDAIISSIRSNTEKFNLQSGKPYQLNFSVGYGIYDPSGDTTDSFIGRIDDAMYQEKRRKKALPEDAAANNRQPS